MTERVTCRECKQDVLRSSSGILMHTRISGYREVPGEYGWTVTVPLAEVCKGSTRGAKP